MSEEKTEKPDWLSDLQNNQATSDKQTCNEGENDQITLDIYGPLNTYNSPRYGRRSSTGIKSVENSPKKSFIPESKSSTTRSNSARPVLLKNISPNDSDFKILNDHNVKSSLQFLETDFKKFSLNELSETIEKVSNPSIDESNKIYKSLEDSWNSLNIFNIKQKGRLGSSTEDIFTKEKDEKVVKDTLKHQLFDENIYEERTVPQSKTIKNVEDSKFQNKTENWDKSRKQFEDGTKKFDTKDFIIPELPKGRILVFDIKTTWGDKHYLGLNGIEIFNSSGKKVGVKSIMANPPDINILPEYSKDPRVVENLIDNIYLTKDDVHMWLAPFTPNSSHLILIEFYEIEELAMLRVWNYNKSRIHCYRGAKDVEIKLDDRFIFIGEIARASGEIINTLNCLGDTILFTTDDDILELVSENDEYFIYSTLNHFEVDQTTQEELRPLTGGNKEKEERPFTCPKRSNFSETIFSFVTDNETHENKPLPEGEHLGMLEIKGHNPFNLQGADINQTESKVCGLKDENSLDDVSQEKSEDNSNWDIKSRFPDLNYTLYIPSASFEASDFAYETLSMPTGYNFTIQIHSTWGDLYYVGLNGLQIFDENNKEIQIDPKNIVADPESINVLEGIDNDGRTPEKLIDGINNSVEGCHMWLAPVLPLTINRIDLIFQDPVTLSALKLWNYAKTPSRGVREFGILVDGLLIYNGELDQATTPTDGGFPKVPCKTVNFSNAGRVSNTKIAMDREETSGGMSHSADQSQRPLTTMTNQS